MHFILFNFGIYVRNCMPFLVAQTIYLKKKFAKMKFVRTFVSLS